jgi:hypothetical protein
MATIIRLVMGLDQDAGDSTPLALPSEPDAAAIEPTTILSGFAQKVCEET